VISNGPPPAAVTEKHLRFDGVNDVVTGKDIDLPTQMTVEAWIRPLSIASNTSQDRILSKDANLELMLSSSSSGCGFGSSGHLQWRLTISGTNVRLCGGTVTLNAWQHVAATFNGSALQLYIDGQLVANATRNGSLTANNIVMSMGNVASLNRPFHGDIDEVRLWKRVRTQSEILANMNLELSGPDSNLAAYYRYNEMSGQAALDSTVNKRNSLRGKTNQPENNDPQWRTN
jgi:hypothetical protein